MLAKTPSTIIVTGMFRSGSTRLYNLIRESLLARHPTARSGHFGSEQLLDAALSDGGPGVFKAHTVSSDTANRVRAGEILAVATIREPMSSMVSLCSAFGWPPDLAVAETDRSLVSLEDLAGAAMIYPYLTATARSPIKIRHLMSDVGLRPSLMDSLGLAHRWSRTSVAHRSRDLICRETGTYDPETLLHPGHVGGVRSVDEATLCALQLGAHDLDLVERFQALHSLTRGETAAPFLGSAR